MTDINIPPEALEAAAREIAPHPWSIYTDAARDHFRHKALAAIRAALAAWPGKCFVSHDIAPPQYNIILPLTENTDAEA